jgi:hypothetical protein
MKQGGAMDEQALVEMAWAKGWGKGAGRELAWSNRNVKPDNIPLVSMEQMFRLPAAASRASRQEFSMHQRHHRNAMAFPEQQAPNRVSFSYPPPPPPNNAPSQNIPQGFSFEYHGQMNNNNMMPIHIMNSRQRQVSPMTPNCVSSHSSGGNNVFGFGYNHNDININTEPLPEAMPVFPDIFENNDQNQQQEQEEQAWNNSTNSFEPLRINTRGPYERQVSTGSDFSCVSDDPSSNASTGSATVPNMFEQSMQQQLFPHVPFNVEQPKKTVEEPEVDDFMRLIAQLEDNK